MDIEERKQRLEVLRLAAQEAEKKHSAAREKLSQEQYALAEIHGWNHDDYDYDDDNNFSQEDLVNFAEGAEQRAKAALDAAVTAYLEEEQRYIEERSALTIRSADEERAGAIHWDRRFHTSLAIGHGAAFAAIVAHAFDHDTSQAAIQNALPALLCFGAGLMAGGAIPLLLARHGDPFNAKATLELADRARRDGRAMGQISAGLFALGVALSIFGVWKMAYPVKPAKTTEIIRQAPPSARPEPPAPAPDPQAAEVFK